MIPAMLKTPEFEQLIKSYPKAMLPLISGIVSGVNIFTVEGMLSYYFLAIWWIVIIAGFAIAFATGIVSKEMDEGTIEFLLTEPISRASVILTRFAALAFYILVLIVVTLGSIALLALVYDVEIKSARLVGVGLVGFALLLTVSAYTLLFSVIFKGRGKAVAWSVVIIFVTHLINALSGLNKTVKELRFLSLFRYYNPYKILTTGDIPWRDLAVFAVVFVVCIVLSVIIFQRKDIAVT
jgi:ABC-2 type transport system permease protein